MDFKQRVANVLIHTAFNLFKKFSYFPKLESVIDEQFPEYKGKRPSLVEMQNNAGMVLQYGHTFIMDGLRPTSPNFVLIGMMKCEPPPPLPKDLQEFMDKAEHGVILVSFGSVLQGASTKSEHYKLLSES